MKLELAKVESYYLTYFLPFLDIDALLGYAIDPPALQVVDGELCPTG